MNGNHSQRSAGPAWGRGAAVLLMGWLPLCAAGADPVVLPEPMGGIPIEADVTEVDPDDFVVPSGGEEVPQEVREALPEEIDVEELLGLRGTCPCLAIGAYSTPLPATTNVFRGNIYRMAPAGPTRLLCKFEMELTLPAGGADLCFYVYQRNPQSGKYEQMDYQTRNFTTGGKAFYASPSLDLELTAGYYYLLGVAWGNVSIGYGRDGVQYPATYTTFGTVEGRFGINLPCPEATPLTISLLREGAYSQKICLAPPKGACCFKDDIGELQCLDTLPDGFPMDYDTCLNDYSTPQFSAEFTYPGFTCADLVNAGGCEGLHHGACCWEGDCRDVNPYLCDYFDDYLPGGPSVYHDGIMCETEICDPRGVCCSFNGDCHNYTTETECLTQLDGAEWHNPLLEPNMICTNGCTPLGACCLANGQCLEKTEQACIVIPGTYMGDGVHCDGAGLLCQTATGVCCIHNVGTSGFACAHGLTRYECEAEQGGMAWIQGLSCTGGPCQYVPDRNACCRLNMSTFQVVCDELEEVECISTNGPPPLFRLAYHWGYECSTTDVCRSDLGACCILGECRVLNNTDCLASGGDFYATSNGWIDSCDVFGTCPAKGACCTPTGCQENILEDICTNGGGVFAGPGVPCGWACNLGACCLGVDDCAETTQMACLQNDGAEFRKALSSCAIKGICSKCPNNDYWDSDDIAAGTSQDCNTNGTPDECEIDVHTPGPGGPYFCTHDCDPDCNVNGIPDGCDLDGGTSTDLNNNAVPDECEDCNTDGLPDECDLSCTAAGGLCNRPGCGLSLDCNGDRVPDECPLADCRLDLVFVLDTSGSMSDEIGMLCSTIDAVLLELTKLQGIALQAEVLGITATKSDGDSGEGRGVCPCCTSTVLAEYGATASGLPEVLGDCWSDPGQGQGGEEDWAPATAVVAANKTWTTGSGRLVVPISDEGPRCGWPENDPGSDRDAIDHALPIVRSHAVIVSPIIGSPWAPVVVDLAQDLSDGAAPGGLVTLTNVANLGQEIMDLVTAACQQIHDCNANGTPDDCDITAGTSEDCNSNAIADECEYDCNGNGIPDDCDIAAGTSHDCQPDGLPDECQPIGHDCNGNTTPDECDILHGTSQDCQPNGTPDECDIGIVSSDVNDNGIPDECEDCNTNGIPDDLDIASGTSTDCQHNGTPDDCELVGHDCNGNGTPDGCELAGHDCNANGTPDACDIAAGTSDDCQLNDIPDDCELVGHDCNGNTIPDDCDILHGTSADCQPNSIPDTCDLAAGTSLDCQPNGIPDSCDIAGGTSTDADGNDVPDECAVLTSALPADQSSLWRSARNTLRLYFGSDITAPGAGQIWIEPLLDGGLFGPDLAANFSFTVENIDVGGGDLRPRVLKIRETAASTVLSHRTWIGIRHRGGWTGVANFEVQYVVMIGDANTDKKVLATDLSAIFPKIPTANAPDQERADVNGDGKVLATDLSPVFPRIPSATPPKPTGH